MSLEDEDAEEMEEDEALEPDEDEEEADEESDEDDEAEEEGEDETIILIGDEEPEDQDVDEAKAPKWVLDLREANKQHVKEKREQAARIKSLEEKLGVGGGQEPAGTKPKLEEFDYDEDKFATALEAWTQKKAEEQRRKDAAAQKEKQHQERYNAKLAAYNEEKASVPVRDFESLEARVLDNLSEMQQGMIITAAKKPASVFAALGQHPKHLEHLAKIEDPVEFIAETVRLEMNMKTTQRKRPEPEKKVPGSTTSFRGVGDKKLEALEAKAEKTGDRSEVLAYKRSLRRS